MAADVQQQRDTGSDIRCPDSGGRGGLETAHKLYRGICIRSSHYPSVLESMLYELVPLETA
jgi:hypothetical protein